MAAKIHTFPKIVIMEPAVCVVPVCPMRKESSHRSEMVSELLFGETAEILETTKQFSRVRGSYDGYEGWCQSAQLAIAPNTANNWHKQLSTEWITSIKVNGISMQLSLGSSLDMLRNGKATIGPYEIRYEKEGWDPTQKKYDPDTLCTLAHQYLNTPYLWGGRSVFGIDCSGLVQQVFRFYNRQLPRDAYQQVDRGEVIGFLQEVRPGDLAFFDNEEGRIIHVGILLGPDRIIHSSGKVRIDHIDTLGIINTDTGQRTHQLRVIKRIS